MDVLVLSSSYEPINQVTWDRAMTLVHGDHSGKRKSSTRASSARVEVIEEYTDWNVRTPRTVFKVPAVIRFLEGSHFGRRSVRFSRENVYTRDKGRCQYCGTVVAKREFTYDHVIPRGQGGRTRWENVVVCCLGCNQKKGNRTPAQAGLSLLVKPDRPRSLPGHKLALPDKVPDAWKPYLRDFSYWNAELESD